jgi:hypothetical protein
MSTQYGHAGHLKDRTAPDRTRQHTRANLLGIASARQWELPGHGCAPAHARTTESEQSCGSGCPKLVCLTPEHKIDNAGHNKHSAQRASTDSTASQVDIKYERTCLATRFGKQTEAVCVRAVRSLGFCDCRVPSASRFRGCE